VGWKAPKTCHLPDSSTPPMTPPRLRKRRLAARIADQDDVSEPVPKQRRLALQQHGEASGADVDDVDTRPSARDSAHLRYEHLIGVAESNDDDVLSEVSTPSGSEGDVNDILNEFVHKKGEKRRREGNVAAVTETETPEEELGSFRSHYIFPRELNCCSAVGENLGLTYLRVL